MSASTAEDHCIQPRVVFGFAITRGKIVEIDLVADPEHLGNLRAGR